MEGRQRAVSIQKARVQSRRRVGQEQSRRIGVMCLCW
jgi:hypothetical protein